MEILTPGHEVNVDPISRLRRRIPHQEAILPPDHQTARLSSEHETLGDFYNKLSPNFEERILELAKNQASLENSREEEKVHQKRLVTTTVPVQTPNGIENINYTTSKTFSILIQVENQEIQKICDSYLKDDHFKKVLSK